MVSGIKPEEDHISVYNNLKLDKKLKLVVFNLIDKNSKLEVEFSADRDFDHNDLGKYLPEDDCRFAILDFEFENNEDPPRKCNKIVLILWCPEKSNVRRRVPFSTTVGALKASFPGIHKDIQANDYQSIEFSNIRDHFV